MYFSSEYAIILLRKQSESVRPPPSHVKVSFTWILFSVIMSKTELQKVANMDCTRMYAWYVNMYLNITQSLAFLSLQMLSYMFCLWVNLLPFSRLSIEGMRYYWLSIQLGSYLVQIGQNIGFNSRCKFLNTLKKVAHLQYKITDQLCFFAGYYCQQRNH